MVTFANISDPDETQATIDQMIMASDLIAANLAETRDKWSALDHDLARLIEGLRIQFAAFASAARSGRITDLVTLRTLGRAYESVAELVHEIALETDTARGARDRVAKASQLTSRVAELVERSH